jgi:hypothetical protein
MAQFGTVESFRCLVIEKVESPIEGQNENEPADTKETVRNFVL